MKLLCLNLETNIKEAQKMKKAQMQNDDALCIVCREGITNPICPECLAKEMKHVKGISPYLFTPGSEWTDESEVRCLFCGKGMSICAHCYSSDIDNLIGKKKPKLQEEFRELFGLREGLF
jgi:hypothetical protein